MKDGQKVGHGLLKNGLTFGLLTVETRSRVEIKAIEQEVGLVNWMTES